MLILTADKAIEELKDATEIIVDTETKSLHPWKYGKIISGLGVKALGGTPFYMPVRHKDTEINAPWEEIERIIEMLYGKRLIMHNAKFDMAVLYQEGWDFSEADIACTMVLARLCYENEPNYSIESLCAGMAYHKISEHSNAGSRPTVVLNKHAGDEKRALRDLKMRVKKAYGLKHIDQVSYDMFPPEEFESYACQDLKSEEQLYLHCLPLIKERNLSDLWKLERDLTIVLFDLERAGFQLDMDYIAIEHAKTTELLNGFESEITRYAKREVNYNSSHDVKKVMADLGIKSEMKTGTGKESWSKGALAMSSHPLAEIIVMARAIYKIRGSYYESFQKLTDDGGVIHANINQAGAKTGRMSCREPNLQNIPRFEGFTGSTSGAIAEGLKMAKAKKEAEKQKQLAAIGKKEIAFDAELEEEQTTAIEKELFGKVRGAFIPREGYFLAFFDWSQIELRIFADYAKELELLEVFDYGLDVHRMTALSAFGVMPEDDQSPEFNWFRNMGKQISFGLIYGMGTRLLAIEIGEGDTEEGKAKAQKFMDAYFGRFRNARAFIDRVHDAVYRKGWLMDRWKRRRYLPSDKAYVGVNFLIQGTAADLMKDAMVRVWNALKGAKLNCQILVPVHDEIIIEIPYAEARKTIELVVSEMSHGTMLDIPLAVDVEWSDTRWSEKRKLKCKGCDGTGKLLNVGQDELLQAMYRSDESFMKKVVVTVCDSCGGERLNLEELEQFPENCVHKWKLGSPDREGVAHGICRVCGSERNFGGQGTTEAKQKAFDYLEHHNGNPILWRNLAKAAGLGSGKLSRLVRTFIDDGYLREDPQFTYHIVKRLPEEDP